MHRMCCEIGGAVAVAVAVAGGADDEHQLGKREVFIQMMIGSFHQTN